jgi:hypothetical protein
VRTAEQDFLILINLEIVGNAVAAVAIAEEYFIRRMFEVKMLHGTSLAWARESVTHGGSPLL